MDGSASVYEGMHWMGSDSSDRQVLWVVTLFSPAFLVGVYYLGVDFYAPLWLLAIWGPHVFLGFLGFSTPQPEAGLAVLASCILWTFPLLIVTGVLDLIPRHRGWLKYMLPVIVAYPLFLLCIEAWLIITGSEWSIVPIPLTSLEQYRRYGQLRAVLVYPVPATTEAMSLV